MGHRFVNPQSTFQGNWGPWGALSSQWGFRGEVLKVAVPGLFYARWVLQYKQVSTSKDTMKELSFVETMCYFKKALITYSNKNSNTIFLHICFNKWKIIFGLLGKLCTIHAVSTKSIRYHISRTKLNLHKICHTAYKIVFWCIKF